MNRLFFLLMTLVTSSAFAQEICNNGIDDDGDGFIDCYDGNCVNDSACAGFFLVNDGSCKVVPPTFPDFTITSDFSSPNETTNHLSRMAVGDLDRDGMPEIITMNRYTKKIFILNGNDGSIKFQKTIANGTSPNWEIAIANVNNDNCAEIYFLGTDSRIYAYDCQLNFLWRTGTMPSNSDPVNFGLADFDGDGLTELYCKDEIYDAHSGRRLIKSITPNNDWDTKINGGPVAADMEGNSNLELVIGLSIYQVNIPVGRATDAGSLTLLKNRNEYFVRYRYNATSVADYNQDGFLDVIASGSTIGHDKNSTIFFWDVQNNVLKTFLDPDNVAQGNAYAPNGWQNGTGRVNIADLDGDGQLNASYVSGKYLYALDENLNKKWRVVINEETSGYTGCTLFDFNGDGKSEIVYRDEQYLYIIDGTNGSIFTQQRCISRTNREYPIVADVDADGSTEICVTCGFDDALSWANFNDLNYSQYSHVRVFKSATDPWVPARRLWNQHGYFVVNVNDDLTIPKIIQKHQLVFSTGSCTQGPNRPLNKFLNQSPFLNTDGCPIYAAPDLAYTSGAPQVDPPTCPDLDFTVSFDITNNGDVVLTGDIPITFYSSNPFKAGATKLNTVTISINNLATGEIFSATDLLVNGIGSDSIYMVLNDDGSQVAPITLPNTNFFECDYINNAIAVKVTPLPVALTAATTPNEICSSPSNGSAEANIGGNTVDYNFYWFNGTVAGPIGSADFVGSVYSGIADGDYRVYGIHKTANCSSDTVSVVVGTLPGILPVVTVNLLSNQTSCNPPNGSLEAVIAGGNAGYTFEWEDAGAPIGVSGPLLVNQPAGTYRVVVSSTGGCSSIATGVIGDQTQEPDVVPSSTPVSSCSNPSAGTVSAQAFLAGVAQPSANYTFDWYLYDNVSSTRGSQLPLANGASGTPNRTGLTAGYYEVEITEIATGCTGTTSQVIQVGDLTTTPTIRFTELLKQTSCDFTKPNGRLQANAFLNGVAQPASDYTFEWFEGQNTLPANQILAPRLMGTNNQIVDAIKASGQSYTVRIENIATGCFAVKDTIISDNILQPVVTLLPADNGICNPALASSNFTGSVTATVTFDGVTITSPFTNYKFEWYNGSVVKPAPDYPLTTTSLLSPLDSGYYTLSVTRTDLNCASVPKTAQVNNTTVLPVISADANASTSCLPALKNGGVQVTDVDGAGTPVTYNYEWHRGNTIAGALVSSAFASPDTLQGGVGKFFTVLVTNTVSGCQNTSTVEVPDARVIPVLSLLALPNNICNPALTSPAVQFNGSVTASITNQVGLITDYTFAWTDEETGLPLGGVTGVSLTQRDSSHYSAVATHTLTGCISTPAIAQVTQNISLPAIAADANASTNCSPLLKNGGVQVTDVDGAGIPTSYNYEWHRGNSIAGYLVSNTAVSPDTLQGAPGRFYTVLVTKQSNGCQNTSIVEVPDDRELPLISLTSSPNTICAGVPDGTASLATLTDRGVNILSPFTGYTFAWETGATTSTLLNRAAGNYSLKVKSTATGCESDSAFVDVINNLFIPPVNIAAGNQTSCDNLNPNGTLAATINETAIGGGAAVTAGYTYTWENNNNPFATPGTGAGNTSTISNLKGNVFYSVTVLRSTTNCSNSKTVFLPEIITTPVVAAAVSSDVTRCDTPNGSILATVGGAQVGYTFFWLNEVGNNQTASNATVISNADANFVDNGGYNGLIPGYYTVVAKDNNTSCLSQPITKQVKDVTVQTTLTITPGPVLPSSCGAADGQMSGTVAGGVGPFTMLWHMTGPVNDSINFFNNPPQFTPPNDVPFATVIGSVSNLSNLTSQLYTLVVQDQGNGCGNYQTIFLPFINAHTIATAITPSTICPYTIGNGEIDVTVGNITGGNNFQDFTYKLYTGENPLAANLVNPPGTIGPGAGTSNPQIYSALAPGKYTIEVRQDAATFGSNCPVYEVVEIESLALSPLLSVTGTVANNACDLVTAANGQATILISKDPNDLTTGFTYDIDVNPAPLGWGGVVTTGPYPPVALPEAETIAGLSPAVPQYTITVTSSNQCVSQRFVSIPNQPAVSQILNGSVTVTPALYCDPALEVNAGAEVTSLSIIGGGPDNLNDYEFSWFSDITLTTSVLSNQDGVSGAGKGGEVLSNIGAPLPVTPVTVGSYWVVAEKEDVGTTGGVGCLSSPFKVDIIDQKKNPEVLLTSTSNTACDASFEGALKVQMTNAGSVPAVNYTYTWTTVVTPIVPPPFSNGDGNLNDDNFTLLQEGLYILQAKNNSSGCTVNGQTTISKTAVPIIVARANKTDQDICDPDGSITVKDITVGGIVDPVHTNFDFTWYVNDPASVPVINAVNGEDVLDVSNLPSIGAGSYFVKAKKISGLPIGSGCESAPLRVDILDISEDPTVQLTPVANTSCDASFEGAIKVQVTDPGSAAAGNYTYTWTTVVTPIVPPPTSNGDGNLADDNFTLLQDGLYILQVENNASGCTTTSQTTISKTAVPIIVASADKTDQAICNPDGSITVKDITVGGVVDINHNNFDFTWYISDPTSVPVINAMNGEDVLDTSNLPSIGAGIYYVKAKKISGLPIGSGCESAPLRVDILDISEDPGLVFNPVTPNSSCNVANPNGLILATASERDGTTDVYTFAWLYNGGVLNPVTTQNDLSPVSQLNQASEGDYSLLVTNTLTGCSFNGGLTLNLDQSLSLPNIVNVLPTNPVNCFPTGSARVAKITIGSSTTFTNPPDDIDTNFDYEWYKGSSAPASVLPGETASSLLNQLPDTYFVLVKDLSTDCQSTFVEFVIDTASIVYPAIAIQQTTPQVSCNVLTGAGTLVATSDGQNDTNPNYSFTWFPSLDLSGLSFASTSTITNLFSGDYSVQVFNALTNCSSSALFIVPNDSLDFAPRLALSSGPQTLCNGTDGLVAARALTFPVNSDPSKNYPFTYNYTADLYVGAPPADINIPEFPNMGHDPGNPLLLENFLQQNLADSIYTVRLTDNNTGCFTIDTVSILNERVFPAPTITALNPMTNCNPSKPNGVARALVNGTFVNYQFDWYEANTVTGTPVYTGSEYNLLKPTPVIYTIEATQLITGCKGTVQTQILNSPLPIPAPEIVVVSHVTSCIENNGALRVFVPISGGGEDAQNYTFDWYDGTQEVPPADFTGVIYDSLAVGTYSVTATSIITGCKSPLVSENIEARPSYPEINFIVQSATCEVDDGYATLIIRSDINIDDITWRDSNGNIVEMGPNFMNAPAGVYSVTVSTLLGCEATKEIPIDADIRPYNGISRGSTPGQNDYFHIDCIQNFTIASGAPEDNIVQIFNRAGTLVYEALGYDNETIYFEGKSNKGISPMGNNLPDGTYFFIINKRDGSKPVVGYLEVVH